MSFNQLQSFVTLVILVSTFIVLMGYTDLYIPMSWFLFMLTVAIYLSSLKK